MFLGEIWLIIQRAANCVLPIVGTTTQPLNHKNNGCGPWLRLPKSACLSSQYVHPLLFFFALFKQFLLNENKGL
jgi:hypothetical protein